jgi:hypothetical protein
MRDVISRIVDGSRFREFKKEYGPTVITVRLSLHMVAHVHNTKTSSLHQGFRPHTWISRWDSRQQWHPLLAISTQSIAFYPIMLTTAGSFTISCECNRFVWLSVLSATPLIPDDIPKATWSAPKPSVEELPKMGRRWFAQLPALTCRN